MIYSLLLLALLPALLMPDGISADDDEQDDQPDATNTGLDAGENLANFLDDPADAPLDPVIEDDDPGDEHGSGDDALTPTIDDDSTEPALPPVIEDDVATGLPNTPDSDVLPPVVEDDFDDPTDLDPDDIRPPAVEDDVADGAADPDVLEPVIDDDIADQPEPADTAPSQGHAPVEITKFDPEKDVLRIKLNPGHDTEKLDITTRPSQDGQDTLVFLDDTLVAKLTQSPDVDASHVHLELGETMSG